MLKVFGVLLIKGCLFEKVSNVDMKIVLMEKLMLLYVILMNF